MGVCRPAKFGFKVTDSKGSAFAGDGEPGNRLPGGDRRRSGEIVVTALSDGYRESGLEMLRNITVEESSRLLRAAFRPEMPGMEGGGRRTAVNCYAVHSSGRLALIKTGSGNCLQPTAGLTEMPSRRPASRWRPIASGFTHSRAARRFSPALPRCLCPATRPAIPGT